MIGKGTGGLGNKRTNEDLSNCSIVEIGQHTQKCSGDLKTFAVTQTPVEDRQLTLV